MDHSIYISRRLYKMNIFNGKYNLYFIEIKTYIQIILLQKLSSTIMISPDFIYHYDFSRLDLS